MLGVAKWAAETFLQGFSGERGLLRDAAIVIAVVLVFAALQPRVTKYVTRIFFGSWHRAAERFQAFVDDAAHMNDGEMMKRRFIDAVDALSDGQGSALYVADPAGHLQLEFATLPGASAHLQADGEVMPEARTSCPPP